jgi:signal peptidase I
MSRDTPQKGDLVQINDTWLYAGYVGVVTGEDLKYNGTINILFGGSLGHQNMFPNRVRIISKGGSHDAQDQHR